MGVSELALEPPDLAERLAHTLGGGVCGRVGAVCLGRCVPPDADEANGAECDTKEEGCEGKDPRDHVRMSRAEPAKTRPPPADVLPRHLRHIDHHAVPPRRPALGYQP